MSLIGVPYHLDEYLPDLDLAPRPDQTITADLTQAGVDPSIVWLDAHGDVQTPETTTSGYLGGMPLRLLAGGRRHPAPIARHPPDRRRRIACTWYPRRAGAAAVGPLLEAALADPT